MPITGNRFSVYLHIPFCTKKCDYCHFFVQKDNPLDHPKLIEALTQEWKMKAPLAQGLKLHSVYFGGGTPSLLDPSSIESLLCLFNFDPEVEITLEGNPDYLPLEKLKAFKSLGINRLSLGAQSFNDEMLVKLGRTHTSSAIPKTLDHALQAGFTNLSIDLMYDLPSQTLADWRQTLKIGAHLPITHLSLYNLTFEPGAVFYKRKAELNLLLPDPETSRSMYLEAREVLTQNGLRPYEISAFSRPGYESQHNLGYWLGRPFLGLGPSAFSYWNNIRYRNITPLKRYFEKIQERQDPADFYDEIPFEDRKKELFIVALRVAQGVVISDFEKRYGLMPEGFHEEIQKLIAKGWLLQENDTIKLSLEGILFYDSLAEALI